MFKWMRRDWGQRQMGAMADLVGATRQIAPDWQEITIKRKNGGVLFSIVSDTAVTVHDLGEH